MTISRDMAVDGLLSPRRRVLLQGMGAALLAAGCGDVVPRGNAVAFGGPTMGSTYTAKIAGAPLSPSTHAAARGAVASALEDVVARMSTYLPDSEVTRLAAHRDGTPFPLSADTFAVLALAREVSAASQGAFDVTVRPAVDAWGFGPGHDRRRVPADEIAHLRPQVGWHRLQLDAARRTATKATPDLAVDLSGIAKGYAVDLAARALDTLGIADYMIEAGGEIRAKGRNAQGVPWQIAIERPDAVPQQAYRIVPLADLAMATSGDYRNFFERDGVRYCHEIDPATAAPIRHDLASVTVVCANCGEADAWATALIVLGPDHGYALAQARGLAAHFIVRERGGGFREFATTAFASLDSHAVA